MVALLFFTFVVGSLSTSVLLLAEVIPATPAVLAVIGFVHVVFFVGFIKAYRAYHSLHRLLIDGQGELFDLAIGQLVATSRVRGLRDHYRLRRCQGLVHSGQSLEALQAAEQYRQHAKGGDSAELALIAAEAEANLQLVQSFWTRHGLGRARTISGSATHAGLQALEARLLHEEGHAVEAAARLSKLTRIRTFALTRVTRARNWLWYGEALAASGDGDAAERAYRKAARLAPHSYYGRIAAAK